MTRAGRVVFALMVAAAFGTYVVFTAPPQPGNEAARTHSDFATGAAPTVSDAPWPRSADGRLVFDIFAHRIALSACDTCERDVRFLVDAPASDTNGIEVDLGEAIRNPAALRRALLRARRVRLVTKNLGTQPGLLFGTLERRLWPASTSLVLSVFRGPLPATNCADMGAAFVPRLCKVLLRLASEAARTDAAGFVVQQGAPGAVGPDTLFVRPEPELRSANGLPAYFVCNWAAFCGNDENAMEGPGYLFAPDLGVSFDFREEDYPETEWIALQQRLISLYQNHVLLDRAP